MRSTFVQTASALALVLVLGCSGGGGNGGGRVGGTVVTGGDIVPDTELGKGKVGKAMSFILDPVTYQQAKANPSLYPAGSRYEDSTNTVYLQPTSLKGILIYANESFIGSTDSTGVVRLTRQPAAGETVRFRENAGQPTFGAMGATEFLDALKRGNFFIPIQVDDSLNVQAMDGPLSRDDGVQEGCGTDCGSATFSADKKVTKKPDCCLDYNGTFSSGNPPTEPCDPDTSKLTYLGSTCHGWVYDEVCGHGFGRHYDVSATDAGQCDRWHKGRYCAAIDDSAFKVTDTASSNGPSRKVNVGDTVVFTILNNTRNNETIISRDKGDAYGTLTAGPELVSTGLTTYQLNHYEDSDIEHSGFKWFEERQVRYTALLPPGEDDVKVTFTFGQLHPQKITIRVCHQ